MGRLNNIGIDAQKAKKLAKKLNVLLADYSMFYQNVRGYHWNVRGSQFFELHVKFEELYNDLFMKIDEVAERILTLGYEPNHSFSEYKKVASIPEAKDMKDGKGCVVQILAAFKVLIKQQRTLMELSDEAEDEGTNALMSDYIREQEKLVWMYTAYLG